MSLWSRIQSSLSAMVRRSQMEGEMDAELRFHLEAYAEDLVRSGVPREEAMRRARIEFGGMERVKEECREARGVGFFQAFWLDTRYGLRTLRKSPGFTAIAVATLALGIGINTAMFSVANGLLFSSLHIEQQSRVQQIGSRRQDPDWEPRLSLPEFHDLTASTRQVFSAVFGGQYSLDGLSMEGSKPDRVFTEYVTGNYFQALGVKPLLGRFFRPSEGVAPGADPYVVLSYTYWKQHFAADPNIVGRKIAVDSVPVTVIGVAPRDYRGLVSILQVQAYVPLAMIVPIENTPLVDFNKQTNRSLRVYGRLRPGMTVQQADAALAVAADQLSAAHPVEEKDAHLRAFSLEAARVDGGDLDQNGSSNVVSAIFMGLAFLVLLLACVNVANLLLVRATVREREMVMRSALGAQRSRLIRQTLTESLLLALLGGTGGVLFGRVGSSLLASVNLASDLPIHFDFPFDWHVLAFSVAVAVLTGLVVGIVPAVRMARANLNLVLREDGRGIAGRSHRFRNALVTVQVAAALLLLIIAGLFTRTLEKSEHVDLGFDPSRVLTMMVDPSEIGYDTARSAEFYNTLIPLLRAVPGVVSATTALSIPMGIIVNDSAAVTIGGYTPPPGQPPPSISFNVIGTDYFRTLRIPLQEGRAFTDADRSTSQHVAIVSRAMADQYWPRQDPIGRTFKLSFDPTPMQIVGVAGNARYGTMVGDLPAYFYLPYTQHSNNTLRTLELRTQGDPAAMIAEIERTIHGVAPALPVFEVQTLQQALYSLNGFLLFQVPAALAGIMGTLGLVLAVVGVYGVLSYVVSQKTSEIGVRMALGAQRGDILRIVFRQGLWIVGIGLALGLAASFGAAHLVHSLITVSPVDPETYVAVSAALATIAMLACYVPARRAMLVEPMQALRQE